MRVDSRREFEAIALEKDEQRKWEKLELAHMKLHGQVGETREARETEIARNSLNNTAIQSRRKILFLAAAAP